MKIVVYVEAADYRSAEVVYLEPNVPTFAKIIDPSVTLTAWIADDEGTFIDPDTLKVT